jgi:hypothetical protein
VPLALLWDQPQLVSLAMLYGALAALAVGAAIDREVLRAPWAELGVGARAATLVLALGAALASWVLAPHAPIDPNGHGVARFVALRDGGWWGLAGAEAQHGVAWDVAMRAAWRPLASVASPFTAQVAWVFAPMLALAALVRRVTGREEDAVGAVAFYACLPATLVVGPTLSLLAVAPALLIFMLLGLEAHLRSRSTASMVVTLAAATLATQTHLEMLGVTPVVMAGWVAARAGVEDLRGLAWSRWAACAAPAGVSVGLYLREALAHAGPNMMSDLGGEDFVGAARRATLQGGLLLVAGALVGRTLPRLGGRARQALRASLAVSAAGAAIASLAAAYAVTATPFAGVPRAPDALVGPFRAWSWVHVWFEPDWTPLLWPMATGLGAVVGAMFQPRRALAWLGVTACMAWVYGGRWDCLSTTLRGAPVLSLALAWPAGAAFGAALRASPARGHFGLAVAVGAVVAQAYLWRDQVAWTWDVQADFLTLAAAAEAGGASAAYAPGEEDVGSVPQDVRAGQGQRWLPGGELVGQRGAPAAPLSALLATVGDEAAGAVVALPLACLQPVTYFRYGDAGQTWFFQGRPIAAAPLPAGSSAAWQRGRAAWTAPLNLALQAPCWATPERATCARSDADGGCARYACTEGAAPADLRWEHPACAAVREAFRLEPVWEVRLGGAPMGLTGATPLDPEGVVGAYRVLGRR